MSKSALLLRDPEKLRKLPRPLRDLFWSIPIILGERIAKHRATDTAALLDALNLEQHIAERGSKLEETAVTSGQSDLLLRSLNAVENLKGNIAEIGSWRGITTTALAGRTEKTVFAIDPHPFGAFEGVEEAYQAFQKRISEFKNIRYIRKCSGDAFRECSGEQFSLVFVDAMHDFISASFDLSLWASQIEPGGFLALHDVDDHPGVNLALQRTLRRNEFSPWGYCPNLAILKKCR